MTRTYADKKERLIAELNAHRGRNLRLAKRTSNLFRVRAGRAARIDVRDFNRVIALDRDAGTVDVEGMITYEDLVAETLRHGLMPAVVPELRSITVGGSIAGGAIESSSFKYGLVHETVRETEVLVGDGRTIVCSPTSNADLFYGFPNTYGTLGYVLRAKLDLVPVKPVVRLSHRRFDDAGAYFRAVGETCKSAVDFVDGTVFGPRELYLTTGVFTAAAGEVSDYTYLDRYYRSIQERETDRLSVADYIWRWDTDWFWCSKHFGLQHRLVRRLFGRKRLRSTTYWAIMNFNRRYGLTRKLEKLGRARRESVIQDIEVPLARAREFLEFFHAEIGISPVWMCPTRVADPAARFDFFPFEPNTLWVNFGFWDTVKTTLPNGHYNRLIETKVAELGGRKSLYSDSYYSEDEFWRLFDRDRYIALKAEYDPDGVFKDLYQKCVLKR